MFKVGDTVIVIKLHPNMKPDVNVNDVLTVSSVFEDTINCKEKLTIGNWECKFFKLVQETITKPVVKKLTAAEEWGF